MTTSANPERNKLFRRGGRLLLILLVLFAVMLLAGLTFSLIRGAFAQTLFTHSAQVDPDDFILLFHVQETGKLNEVEFSLQAVDFPKAQVASTADENDYFCVTGFALKSYRPADAADPLYDAFGELGRFAMKPAGMSVFTVDIPRACANRQTLSPTFDSMELSQSREIYASWQLETLTPAYFYPFDQQYSSALISLDATAGPTEDKMTDYQRPPAIAVYSMLPSWDETVTIEVTSPDEGSHDLDSTEFTLIARRPIGVRILTIILLISAAIFIILLLFIRDPIEFRAAAIGMLFGLWGIQNIIIPDHITYTTIVDNIIVGLYVLLAFVMFLHFFINHVWPRLSPDKTDANPSSTPE